MTLAALHKMLTASGASKPDQVITLITACIESGIVAGPMIVSTLAELGYDARHVGIILNRNSGPNAALRDWYRADNGDYRLH